MAGIGAERLRHHQYLLSCRRSGKGCGQDHRGRVNCVMPTPCRWRSGRRYPDWSPPRTATAPRFIARSPAPTAHPDLGTRYAQHLRPALGGRAHSRLVGADRVRLVAEEMTPTLVFDIETIPDIAGLRRLHELRQRADRLRSGRDRLPDAPPEDRQRFPAACICSASPRSPACCARATTSRCGRWPSRIEDEGSIIQRFFDGIEKIHPADRFLERQRFRPAGAALSRPDPRRPGAALLGHGRG